MFNVSRYELQLWTQNMSDPFFTKSFDYLPSREQISSILKHFKYLEMMITVKVIRITMIRETISTDYVVNGRYA